MYPTTVIFFGSDSIRFLISKMMFQVIGYPSIKGYRRGNEEVDYWGQNNHDDILNFLEFTLRGVRPDEL